MEAGAGAKNRVANEMSAAELSTSLIMIPCEGSSGGVDGEGHGLHGRRGRLRGKTIRPPQGDRLLKSASIFADQACADGVRIMTGKRLCCVGWIV